MLVSFVVGGTQKGGTTALDCFLRQHPEICMPARAKEIHFFDDDRNFKSTPDYRPYHQCFNPSPLHRIAGETTPMYMYWQHAPKRIYHYNPSMQWILLLRNPIDRAYSCWRMQASRGLETLGFGEALAEESSRCQAASPDQLRRYSYLDRSKYVRQLLRIFEYFDPSRCLICLNEDLRYRHDDTMARVFEFLSVDASCSIASEMVFAEGGDGRPPIEPGLRSDLVEFFANEVETLSELLNRDLTAWLQ